MWVNFHFMLMYSATCSTCLFSWYELLTMVGGVGGGPRWWLQWDPQSNVVTFMTNAWTTISRLFFDRNDDLLALSVSQCTQFPTPYSHPFSQITIPQFRISHITHYLDRLRRPHRSVQHDRSEPIHTRMHLKNSAIFFVTWQQKFKYNLQK